MEFNTNDDIVEKKLMKNKKIIEKSSESIGKGLFKGMLKGWKDWKEE